MSKKDDSKDDNSSKDDQEQQAPPPTWLVWSVRIVSTLILFTVVGYLLYLSRLQDIPPEFEITAKFDEIVEHESHFALPIEVRNGATEAVTEVNVEVSFNGVTRNLTLPLMGQGETASLEVVFETRPTENGFEAMVVGYQSP